MAWAKRLRQIYDQAKAFSHPNQKARAKARVRFQQELVALASPFAQTHLPQSTLCKRLLHFESELFTFVEYPSVPSENNPAERAIRPRVIARKIPAEPVPRLGRRRWQCCQVYSQRGSCAGKKVCLPVVKCCGTLSNAPLPRLPETLFLQPGTVTSFVDD